MQFYIHKRELTEVCGVYGHKLVWVFSLDCGMDIYKMYEHL